LNEKISNLWGRVKEEMKLKGQQLFACGLKEWDKKDRP
jgi:hypothetical protein